MKIWKEKEKVYLKHIKIILDILSKLLYFPTVWNIYGKNRTCVIGDEFQCMHKKQMFIPEELKIAFYSPLFEQNAKGL